LRLKNQDGDPVLRHYHYAAVFDCARFALRTGALAQLEKPLYLFSAAFGASLCLSADIQTEQVQAIHAQAGVVYANPGIKKLEGWVGQHFKVPRQPEKSFPSRNPQYSRQGELLAGVFAVNLDPFFIHNVHVAIQGLNVELTAAAFVSAHYGHACRSSCFPEYTG